MALDLKVWTGTEWVNVGSAAANVYYDANQPASAVLGDLWVESDSDTNVLTTGDFLQISTASATYATKASPALTGTPTAPTAATGTNTTQLATTEFVKNQAPLYTNRNLLYNGAMQVSQRGTSTTSITTAAYYTADRWCLNLGSLGTWTNSVESDAPSGSGLAKSLKVLCTTANAAPSASSQFQIYQRLEGQDLQRIAKGTASAQQLTLSFWVKSNVTGTYVAELTDVDNTRQVSASYTISASATWERKTITFPADTTGVFDNDNAASLTLSFWIGGGSNFTSGTLNTAWAATTTANRAVGQTNLAAANNNYWQVTGVQLEVGPVASAFEFEPYEATLRKCQRYYQKSYNVDVNPGTSTTVGAIAMVTLSTSSYQLLPAFRLSPTMRATPTITVYSTTGASGKIRNITDAVDVNAGTAYVGANQLNPQVNNVSVAAGKDIGCHVVAEIEL